MTFAKYCKNHQTPHHYWDNVYEIPHYQKVISDILWSYHTEWKWIECESTNLDFKELFIHFVHVHEIHVLVCTKGLLQVCWSNLLVSHMYKYSHAFVTAAWVNNKGYSKKVLKQGMLTWVQVKNSFDCHCLTELVLPISVTVTHDISTILITGSTHVISTILGSLMPLVY